MLPFSNLGQGSIPARNWVWEHAVAEGEDRHWILDDNISKFYRFNNNHHIRVSDGTIFRAAEEFTDRYANVPMSGLNYRWFCPALRGNVFPPFHLNTRIYSCILLSNKTPHRWRGRYNEDTDLSLRFLKDDYCTILFNAFVCEKIATMTMRGGNTDDLYKDTGRLEMAKSLYRQHPDVVKIARKFGRWQHQVDYRPFHDNRLVLRHGVEREQRINEYGMQLVDAA